MPRPSCHISGSKALMNGQEVLFSMLHRFSFNGQEKDDEVKGSGNALEFGGRSIYDPRLGKFVSIDPRWRDFADMSPYVYAANNPIYFNDEDGKGPSPYVRLMFYGGARKAGDNSAFYYAAQNVNKDYGGTANAYFAESAQFIIDKINSQASGSIQSLDVFTHGSPSAWYMVKNSKTGQPGSTGTTIPEDDVESNNLYASKTAKAFESWGGGSAQGVINSIDFSKFTNNAVVEVHGCRAAYGTCYFVDNMATNISQALYDAGKTRAVVIGHLERANPNINGDKTTNKEQDYRHGPRAVYHNGEVLFTTSAKGRIKQKVIDSYLDKKEKAGSDYDGSKEVYKK
jgi:RHS repeat-associated protein